MSKDKCPNCNSKEIEELSEETLDKDFWMKCNNCQHEWLDENE